ncbi:MAG: hypothetical protein WDO12_11445 [Pseudomonadota bacterium]
MSAESLHVASATGVDVALPIAGAGSRSYALPDRLAYPHPAGGSLVHRQRPSW